METIEPRAAGTFQTIEYAERSLLIAGITNSPKPPDHPIDGGYCWYEGEPSIETPGSQTGLMHTMGERCQTNSLIDGCVIVR